MKKLLELLEANSISVFMYEEDYQLCGYELDTYTECGVNMNIFLDFRGEEEKVLLPSAFCEKFIRYINDIDIDEEIDLHRQMRNYKDTFTIRESVKDFESWLEGLKDLHQKLQEV